MTRASIAPRPASGKRHRKRARDRDGRADPAIPGPGAIPDSVLRSLDLAVMRRIQSLMPGDHATPQIGSGTELATIRSYQPGDDVRYIDWNVTARLREPHVRVHVGERAMTSWLVLDLSPSMRFGTALRRKIDVAEGVALALGHVTSRRGNRLGVVAFDTATEVARPRQGRTGLLALLAGLRVERAIGIDAQPEVPEQPEPAASLRGVVELLGGLARSRGMVMVISDFRGPRDWETRLRQLSVRHGVLAVEIRDPRELELPPLGDVWLIDPESARQIVVNTSRRGVRKRFAKAAAGERSELAQTLRRAGADHLVLSTADDWLSELAAYLRRTERARRRSLSGSTR